jgi:L-fuculose-phosphate aldolase
MADHPPTTTGRAGGTILRMDALAKMCEIGRRAYQRLLVDGTGGNFSCRLDERRVLCTPTLLCKGLLTPADLCVVDLAGRRLEGTRAPSSEVLMHLEIYAASPAVGAVVHCHPPFATTLAVLGETIPTGVLPEGDVFLGAVPLIPYQTPGTRAMGTALRSYVADGSAAILQNHGTVTWGPDLETAYVLTETLEAVCRVVCQARLLGELKTIPTSEQAELGKIRQAWRRLQNQRTGA